MTSEININSGNTGIVPPDLIIKPRECEGGTSGGIIRKSVPTGEALTAALSRLNNVSLIKLMNELVEAINSCCKDVMVPDVTNEQWYIDIITNITKIKVDITNVQTNITN